MEFSPAFCLLAKFSAGLDMARPSEDDTSRAAAYLGCDLPHTSLRDRIELISGELQRQNGILAKELEHDSIFDSDNYRKSPFIREVVANNRINREKRATAVKSP